MSSVAVQRAAAKEPQSSNASQSSNAPDTTEKRCVLCEARLTSHEAPEFWDCPSCGLVQRDRGAFPSVEQERAFYSTHENDVGDPGYRRFLSRLSRPLVQRFAHDPPRDAGLDFGSGPAPALIELLREAGLRAVPYDPLVARLARPELLSSERSYPFITCTEAAEHFHAPAREFARMFSLLQPGGVLALMTEPYREQRPMTSWRYARDPTHVVFYRETTFAWLAARHRCRLERVEATVRFFWKKP